MVYLSSAPHSHPVLDSATAVSWRKLQKTIYRGYTGDMMNCRPELAQVSPPPL